MTDKQGKVGDVKKWSEVPCGALVAATEPEFSDMHALRRGVHCCWVTVDGWRAWDDDETWMPHASSLWKLIALDVPADATAEQLRELAEVFEVRANCQMDVMVMMPGGNSFHCDNEVFESWRRTRCGCNVFRKDERGRFICNGCGAAYIGEPAEGSA